MTTHRDPRFPATIPTDVTISDIDLDAEPFYVGGKRLTETRAQQLAGRPSLTAPGEHSPRLNFRVPQLLKDRLAQTAREQGRRESDVAREALGEYLGIAA